MLRRQDCPLSAGVKRNLDAIMVIRNEVEHNLLGQGDYTFLPLFQASCLNFDKVICDMFGTSLSLQDELSFSLQFARLRIDQLSTVQNYTIPDHIQALDARLREGLSEEDMADLEYQFRVVYTLESASKSRAHIQFVHPESAEGKEISNVLVKYKTGDELYPYKPKVVVSLVLGGSERKFTTHNHVQAWKLYKARPGARAKNPEETNKEYCIYHPAHGDYTYSQKWVDHLVAEIKDEEKWKRIIQHKV
jgi:hypothetical protein